MLRPDKFEIGIYFSFYYLPPDSNKVHYLVIIVDGGGEMETGLNKYKSNMKSVFREK